MTEDITAAELARRMGDVLRQFENLVKQVEERYARKDWLDLYQKGIDLQIQSVKEQIGTKANKSDLPDMSVYVKKDIHDELKKDVEELKASNTWLFRLVIGFVILGVLGAMVSFGVKS